MYDLAAPETISGAAEAWVLAGYGLVFGFAVATALTCRWLSNRRRRAVHLTVRQDRLAEAIQAARDRLAAMTERERL